MRVHTTRRRAGNHADPLPPRRHLGDNLPAAPSHHFVEPDVSAWCASRSLRRAGGFRAADWQPEGAEQEQPGTLGGSLCAGLGPPQIFDIAGDSQQSDASRSGLCRARVCLDGVWLSSVCEASSKRVARTAAIEQVLEKLQRNKYWLCSIDVADNEQLVVTDEVRRCGSISVVRSCRAV